MKTPPAIALVLLAVTTIGLSAPFVAASLVCEEEGGTDGCGLDCAICLCCSHGPRAIRSDQERGSGAGDEGRLRPDERHAPEPWARDILHVPRFALSP